MEIGGYDLCFRHDPETDPTWPLILRIRKHWPDLVVQFDATEPNIFFAHRDDSSFLAWQDGNAWYETDYEHQMIHVIVGVGEFTVVVGHPENVFVKDIVASLREGYAERVLYPKGD